MLQDMIYSLFSLFDQFLYLGIFFFLSFSHWVVDLREINFFSLIKQYLEMNTCSIHEICWAQQIRTYGIVDIYWILSWNLLKYFKYIFKNSCDKWVLHAMALYLIYNILFIFPGDKEFFFIITFTKTPRILLVYN